MWTAHLVESASDLPFTSSPEYRSVNSPVSVDFRARDCGNRHALCVLVPKRQYRSPFEVNKTLCSHRECRKNCYSTASNLFH